VGVSQAQKKNAETPRSFKFVSENRRTCSVSNAAENMQHRNFFDAKFPSPSPEEDSHNGHKGAQSQKTVVILCDLCVRFSLRVPS
jgi:hypothetical protein